MEKSMSHVFWESAASVGHWQNPDLGHGGEDITCCVSSSGSVGPSYVPLLKGPICECESWNPVIYVLRKLPQTGILINSPLLQFPSCCFVCSFGTARAFHEAQTRWELLPLWTASINSKESWILQNGSTDSLILSLYVSRLEIPILPPHTQVFTFSTKHTIFVCLASGVFWHHRASFLQVTASLRLFHRTYWSWPQRMGPVEQIRPVWAVLVKSVVISSGMGM